MFKVSILIPVYNTQETLVKCLDSVLKQTIIEDLEIVIVNDGSNDESEKIINNYISKYKNIVYFYQENKGLGATRNKGIELASGEYIAFLDSDDWVESDYYEKMYYKAIKDNCELIISSYIVECHNGSFKFNVTEEYKSKGEYLEQLIKGKTTGFSWNKLYKKRFIDTNELKFPTREEIENVEDQYFSLRCIALTDKISFMNDSNIHYIIFSDSIVRGYQDDLYKDILNLYRENNIFFSKYKNIDFDIRLLKVSLLTGMITVVNNEFKPNRIATLSEKKSIVNKMLEFEEYKEALRYLDNFKFRKIEYIYLYLIKNSKFNLLFIFAKIRCMYMHYRSNIYK